MEMVFTRIGSHCRSVGRYAERIPPARRNQGDPIHRRADKHVHPSTVGSERTAMSTYSDNDEIPEVEAPEVEAHGMPILDLQGWEASPVLMNDACISMQSVQMER
jgi:hypothetical protein